jgi:hypothetical protein
VVIEVRDRVAPEAKKEKAQAAWAAWAQAAWAWVQAPVVQALVERGLVALIKARDFFPPDTTADSKWV